MQDFTHIDAAERRAVIERLSAAGCTQATEAKLTTGHIQRSRSTAGGRRFGALARLL